MKRQELNSLGKHIATKDGQRPKEKRGGCWMFTNVIFRSSYLNSDCAFKSLWLPKWVFAYNMKSCWRYDVVEVACYFLRIGRSKRMAAAQSTMAASCLMGAACNSARATFPVLLNESQLRGPRGALLACRSCLSLPHRPPPAPPNLLPVEYTRTALTCRVSFMQKCVNPAGNRTEHCTLVHLTSIYRDQVSLGSSLWVPSSLTESLTTTPCWDFADVTLADGDTNSILTENANTMPIEHSKQYVEQQEDKKMDNVGEEVTKGVGKVVHRCRSCMKCWTWWSYWRQYVLLGLWGGLALFAISSIVVLLLLL